MSQSKLKAENARLQARVAELEAQLAAKPAADRASLYRMLASSPWGVMGINSDGSLDFANPALQRFLACPAPAFGVPMEDALTPPLQAAIAAPLAAALAGKSHDEE